MDEASRRQPLTRDGHGPVALYLPVVVDFIDEACHPDSDRSHARNEPKHQRSPPKFGGGDNPDTKGYYAGRDQICGEPSHARVQAEREPFRSIALANFSRKNLLTFLNRKPDR
jgi:hypothetical protein